MRWIVRGDIDGFFGLAIDNLVQLLLIAGLCGVVLGFPSEIIYGRILPGVAVSLIVGNLFYAWQAKRLAAHTGRTDVCALPYGINTVSLFAHVFLVMMPVNSEALKAGLSKEAAATLAWQAGLIACIGSGLIEFFGAFVAERIRRSTPRAALLATLSGIALGFISMSFFFRTFARPEIGLVTLGIILMTYFGAVRFRGGLPGGFVAVLLGTAIAWIIAWSKGTVPDPTAQPTMPGWFPPIFVGEDILAGANWNIVLTYLPVIIPMGIFNLLGSLQNIESAEAAGDPYPTAPSLAVNGLGTLAAAAFGSCFPTTIYIGHPGWKALGSRAGYSVLNAVFFTVVCLTGLLNTIQYVIPVDAGMAIVLYIGIVITAQAFQATPKEHAPAVVLGLLPGVAAWGTLMIKQAMKVAGVSPAETLETKFQNLDVWITGAFSLTEGFVLTSMILASIAVAIIDRRFWIGAVWAGIGVIGCVTGLMHSFRYIDGDTTMALGTPAWQWAIGYASVGVLLATAPWVTVRENGTIHRAEPKS